MPHAEKDMSSPMVNGDKPQSKVLSHLNSYPVINDTVTYYKKHPYGQKSISLANSAYESFGKPFVSYLQTPFSYVKPYVEKADDLADSGLNTVDNRFPLIKEDTNKVKGAVLDYATFPLRLAHQGRDYVFDTFNDEYNKTNGQGIFKLVQATISTELKFGIDAIHLFKRVIYRGHEKVNEKVNQ